MLKNPFPLPPLFLIMPFSLHKDGEGPNINENALYVWRLKKSQNKTITRFLKIKEIKKLLINLKYNIYMCVNRKTHLYLFFFLVAR